MDDAFETAETREGYCLAEHVETVLRHVARMQGAALTDPSEVADAPIPARVNRGRWLVSCDRCSSAELVWMLDTLFMCQNCWNSKHFGAWRRVEIPDDTETIERLLLSRPRENQNWEPGETVEELRAENAAHGFCEASVSRLPQRLARVRHRLPQGVTRQWAAVSIARTLWRLPLWVRVGSAVAVVLALTVGLPPDMPFLNRSGSVTASGLVADAWGAVLVAVPLMKRSADIALLSTSRYDMNVDLMRALLADRTIGAVGLTFLVVGFALQGIAQALR